MELRGSIALSLLLLTACSGDDGGTAAAPPTGSPAPTPAPTPTPSPTPSPIPSPTPTPTSTPSPGPSPTTYMMFDEIYVVRLGAGITLPGACGGLAGADRSVLPVAPFGQSLSFRYVLTPQVWAIGGDGLSLSFDGRTVDPDIGGAEVAHLTTVGGEPVRFSVVRPVPGARRLDYARLASVSVPVAGVRRDYRCVIGISTFASDLGGVAAAPYARTALSAIAQIGGRAHSLDQSVVAIAADVAARRVTFAIDLIAAPATTGAAPIRVGRVEGVAALDPATGVFTGALAGSRPLTGSIAGRLFGPQGIEIAAAIAVTLPANAGEESATLAGAVFGAR